MKSKIKLLWSILSIFILGILIFCFLPNVLSIATNFSDVDMASDSSYFENDPNVPSMSGGRIVGAILNLVRIILFCSSIIISIVCIIKYYVDKNRIKNDMLELNQRLEELKKVDHNINSESEKVILKEKEALIDVKKKNKRKLVIWFVLVFVLLSISGIMSIEQKFAKPIIYLYPETEQEVSVSLGNPEKLTCTYPKYENSWEVLAKPNGDLVDLKTGRNLYSLYWEGQDKLKSSKITEGFCIKGEDSAEFLEEKLAVLGLTDREAEEFIVYWLPELEKNKYNLIRFETMEEINENMPLEIEPKPDTVIRVMMEFKGSNKYIELKAQELVTPERNGFVVIEWGGTEL